jgi:hypothetical protein
MIWLKAQGLQEYFDKFNVRNIRSMDDISEITPLKLFAMELPSDVIAKITPAVVALKKEKESRLAKVRAKEREALEAEMEKTKKLELARARKAEILIAKEKSRMEKIKADMERFKNRSRARPRKFSKKSKKTVGLGSPRSARGVLACAAERVFKALSPKDSTRKKLGQLLSPKGSMSNMLAQKGSVSRKGIGMGLPPMTNIAL